nr:MAG TPA: hypothetical protein [Caudoviricetes sp.]
MNVNGSLARNVLSIIDYYCKVCYNILYMENLQRLSPYGRVGYKLMVVEKCNSYTL